MPGWRSSRPFGARDSWTVSLGVIAESRTVAVRPRSRGYLDTSDTSDRVDGPPDPVRWLSSVHHGLPVERVNASVTPPKAQTMLYTGPMERTAKSAPEEIALGLFEQGFTCGQAVLAAFADLSRAMRRLLLLLLATCACVSAPMARRDLDLRAKILEPSRDAAKLYVYRPGGFVGAGVAVQVFVDEARVGVLKAGTFLAVTLRPGEHAILVRTMGEARQTIVVELGRNYYVRADAAWGWSHPEASVEVIRDERAATEAVRECALVTSLAAEQLRRVATDLADTVVELVGAEALVKEATRALAVMGGNDPSTVPELDEAVDRLRSSRPGVLDNDVVLAGARAMLDMLEPQGTKATRDTTRAIDPSCGLVLRSSGGATVVAAVLPESPAASARVEPGVEIREIDGRL